MFQSSDLYQCCTCQRSVNTATWNNINSEQSDRTPGICYFGFTLSWIKIVPACNTQGKTMCNCCMPRVLITICALQYFPVQLETVSEMFHVCIETYPQDYNMNYSMRHVDNLLLFHYMSEQGNGLNQQNILPQWYSAQIVLSSLYQDKFFLLTFLKTAKYLLMSSEHSTYFTELVIFTSTRSPWSLWFLAWRL